VDGVVLEPPADRAADRGASGARSVTAAAGNGPSDCLASQREYGSLALH
jgi:hypothetical protein